MDSVPKCEPGELRGVDVLIVVSRPRRGGRRWLAAARTLVGVAVPNAEFRSPKGSSARSFEPRRGSYVVVVWVVGCGGGEVVGVVVDVGDHFFLMWLVKASGSEPNLSASWL